MISKTNATPSSLFLARRRAVLVSVLGFAGLVAGCQPEINHRGYYPKKGAFAQVREGMSRTEVEAVMGSPSTTASVNFQGDSFYYISSITQGRAFLNPVEVERQVIAIRFNRQDQVEALGQYGLEDGRIVNINDRKTPVAGQEFSILKELFRNTNVAPGGSMLSRRM